jgi:hypothetical protein
MRKLLEREHGSLPQGGCVRARVGRSYENPRVTGMTILEDWAAGAFPQRGRTDGEARRTSGARRTTLRYRGIRQINIDET